MSAPVRILVVEDDPIIIGNLVQYLELQGHVVDVAYDGRAAISQLASNTYDVVVMDLGLPRVDGVHVLQHMRAKLQLATPVLVLTARDALAQKMESFDAGADDYLTKPYSLLEVNMRVMALHRRATGMVVPADTLRAGPVCLDRRSHAVTVDGAAVRLMPRSMQVLEILLRDPGRVVPRAELESALWPDEEPGPDALRSQIHILRRALSQAGYEGLETVHGVGYRLKGE